MFVDVSSSKGPTEYQWSTTAPSWRMAAHGMCLEGKCCNSKCEAFECMVIMNMGKRVCYQLGMPDHHTVCPKCNQYVNPTVCAFNNTTWRYVGIKITSDGPKRVRGEWTYADNNYYRFDPEVCGTAEWSMLVLECYTNDMPIMQLCDKERNDKSEKIMKAFHVNFSGTGFVFNY